MRHDDHLSDDTLIHSIDHELAPTLRASISAHLQACEPCRSRWETLVSAATELSQACGEDATPEPIRTDAMRARLIASLDARRGKRASSWRDRLTPMFTAVPGAAVVVLAAVAVIMAVAQRAGRVSHAVGASVATVEPDALPVRALTPGATWHATVGELCTEDAARNVEIPTAVRLAVLRDYHMEGVPDDQYELDYLITPELAGATDRRNLWPERYSKRVWNARVKDELEELLPQLVCEGRLDLKTAQDDIAANWVAAYKKYFRTDRPRGARAGDGRAGSYPLALAELAFSNRGAGLSR